jgi:hypothetical protein
MTCVDLRSWVLMSLCIDKLYLLWLTVSCGLVIGDNSNGAPMLQSRYHASLKLASCNALRYTLSLLQWDFVDPTANLLLCHDVHHLLSLLQTAV